MKPHFLYLVLVCFLTTCGGGEREQSSNFKAEYDAVTDSLLCDCKEIVSEYKSILLSVPSSDSSRLELQKEYDLLFLNYDKVVSKYEYLRFTLKFYLVHKRMMLRYCRSGTPEDPGVTLINSKGEAIQFSDLDQEIKAVDHTIKIQEHLKNLGINTDDSSN